MNVLCRWKITWLFFPINLKMVFVDYAYINLYLSRVLLEHLKYCHHDSFLDNTSSIFHYLQFIIKNIIILVPRPAMLSPISTIFTPRVS